MNNLPVISVFSAILLCGFLSAGQSGLSGSAPLSGPSAAAETAEIQLKKPALENQKASRQASSSAAGLDSSNGARVIQYSERDVIRVQARVRFTTLIVLPKTEQILDFVCGDKEFWIVNGAQNFAYIKPAKAGGQTNLNLVTASGNVYSFVLTEGDANPDLKLFVELRDESMISALSGMPRFVPVQQVDDFRQQVEIAKAEARESRQAAQNAIEREISSFKAEYPSQLKFDYRFQPNQGPFMVSAIFHDGKFTYIQAKPQEVPALYEVKDGKPNLIRFEFKNGTYVVDKILDDGYLSIGKQRLPFFKTQD